MTPKSHKMVETFKAYELEKIEGQSFARAVRIGRFEDVCFVGSDVLTMPDSINYDYYKNRDGYYYLILNGSESITSSISRPLPKSLRTRSRLCPAYWPSIFSVPWNAKSASRWTPTASPLTA